jgi:hypothetical protein
MIPKIIHYVWVGNGEKPELAHRCIASWKRYLPSYQIIEWGNSSLVDIKVEYVHAAFRMKKWAFVSDYLRLYALYKFGGFYFDTDLEVTANLDRFLDHRYLTGFENYNGNAQEGLPITALMGAEKESNLIGKMLHEYDNEPFIFADGSLNLLTNTQRITQLMRREYELPKILNAEETLKLDKGVMVYPSHFFSTPEREKENYSIHHFNGSWFDNYARRTLFKIGKFKIVVFSQTDLSKPFNYCHFGNENELTGINFSKSHHLSIIRRI